MYLNLSTGERLSTEQAREVEARNRRYLNSGILSDLSKVQILVKVG